MLTKTLLNLVKGALAVVTALLPTSVPAVTAIAVIGGTVAVTAACGAPQDDGDDGGNDDDGNDDDGGNDD